MSDNERFKEMYKNGWDFVDIETRKPYSYCDCINLLNELNGEKEKLKQISDNKQKHIVHLENKIHRMRKEIKRLDYLSKYRGGLH